MSENLIIGLVLVYVLGIGAQWLAWRTKLPAILLLLVVGIVAGPVTGIINPDKLFGDVLFPLVSVSVAIILFEGGLSLRISELREVGKIVGKLISIGILATWVLSAAGAYYVLGMSLDLSILFGAILIVTGPTVIIPLLRQVRPSGQVGSTLKWEGIVNDPIGAMFAVLVLEVILLGGIKFGATTAAIGILKTVFIGFGAGAAGAGLMIFFLRNHLVPDFLQNPISLLLVMSSFLVSNELQHESGLLAVTAMGVILANQRMVKVRHIIEFKENLRVILISTLFILLASRLQQSDLEHFTVESLLFLGFMIFIVRPVAVWLSTIGTKLNWREKVFLTSMAPRGIVAASVSALFAYRLVAEGMQEAELMVPYTFVIIIGTVAIYGLTAAPLARALGVAKPVPNGVMMLGAHKWARQLAAELNEQGFKVIVTDTNVGNVDKAKALGVDSYHGNILSENALNELDLDEIGSLVALTPNDEVNSLATLRYSEIFGRSQVFQLASSRETHESEHDASDPFTGRILFDHSLNFDRLRELSASDGKIKTFTISKEQPYDSFTDSDVVDYYPLFTITTSKDLKAFTAESTMVPTTGYKMVAFVVPKEQFRATEPEPVVS